MGKYIQEGIFYNIKVSKTQMENSKVNYEIVI